MLGVDVTQLLEGTDAENRLRDAHNLVRRADYDAAVKTIVEYERRTSEAEALARSTQRALDDAERQHGRTRTTIKELRTELEQVRRDHRLAAAMADEHQRARLKHERALRRAVAEIASLRSQLWDLSKAVDDAKKTSRVGQILAGIGAVTGAVTVATLLGRPSDEEDEDIDIDE